MASKSFSLFKKLLGLGIVCFLLNCFVVSQVRGQEADEPETKTTTEVYASSPSLTEVVSSSPSYKNFVVPHTPITIELSSSKKGERPKNIIVLIGDGMGPNQIKTTKIVVVGPENTLNMEKMPVSGLVNTRSFGNAVTDSAAAATALGCGYKTKNGMIGMNPEEEKLTSILEASKSIGKATGLVTTDTMLGATPGGFAVHVKSRKDVINIASQLPEGKRVNVLLGFGQYKPLITKAKETGYTYIDTTADMLSASDKYLLGLFPSKDYTKRTPTLAEMTSKAIEILSQEKKGFFMMAEGSNIDGGGHLNNTKLTIGETADFDSAVGVALEFAAKDKKTLVIVTADHETGGMRLDGSTIDDIAVKWTTKGHSGTMVAIYAYGPGSELFEGQQDNTDIPKKMAQLFKINNFAKK